MASPSQNIPSQPPAAKGLPPVTPPSGRFIAQLFLVPGLIVTMAVLFILFINFVLAPSSTPDYYLKRLDEPNADARWRGASDLAQVLKRPESVVLRADAQFALDLAERLRAAMDELTAAEKTTQEKIAKASPEEQERAWRKLAPQRDHVRYLAATLGDFPIPVGVPLLSEIALREDCPDLKGNTLRRRQAVWALGNLGQNTKDFKKLPAEKQTAIMKHLTDESAKAGPRAAWARNALHYLGLPQTGVVEVDRTLAQVARADDRYLREQVGLVLMFWEGELVEPTLLLLARDRGHGTLIRINEND